MKEYTKEEMDEIKSEIDNLDHEEMCILWRYAPSGHIYFDSTLPFAEYFKDRLYNHFGGFTPEISKRI